LEGAVQYPIVLGDDLLLGGDVPDTWSPGGVQLLPAVMEHLDRDDKGYNLYNKILEKSFILK
jgi:hypothetical protein